MTEIGLGMTEIIDQAGESHATLDDSETTLPIELIIHLLDFLAARELIALLPLSSLLYSLSYSILKKRIAALLLKSELLLESASPAEYTNAQRQILSLTSFSPILPSIPPSISFHLPPSERQIHSFTLDPNEFFETFIISLHLQSKSLPVPSDTVTRSYANRSWGGLNPRFPYKIPLGEGLERIYRRWFKESAVGLPSFSHLTRRTSSQVLYPTSTSSSARTKASIPLIKASIECLLVSKTAREEQLEQLRKEKGSIGTFEGCELGEEEMKCQFWFVGVEVDLARFAVSVEKVEGSGQAEGSVMLWVRV